MSSQIRHTNDLYPTGSATVDHLDGIHATHPTGRHTGNRVVTPPGVHPTGPGD
ncbi:MAG: hypothetical protein ACOH2F_20705 [Cellulomonas sp.]